jgi:hypothetical protein
VGEGTNKLNSNGLSWAAVWSNAGFLPYKTTRRMLFREMIICCSKNHATKKYDAWDKIREAVQTVVLGSGL